MLKRIIAWSATHPLAVGIGTIALIMGGVWAMLNTSVDAIPDLSDAQVIVMTEWPGQAPQLVEDQVTYPLETELLKVPNTKFVRGMSQFGLSAVYVVFEDGTDLYWARSRVLEYLNDIAGKLPPGATTDDYTEILAGVEPGQRVVTSAQFLLDSESNLGEVMKSMMSMGSSSMQGMDMRGADTKGMKGMKDMKDMKGMNMNGAR